MKVEKTQHDGFKPITLSIVIENKEEYDIIECILNRNCSIPKLVEKEWGYGNGPIPSNLYEKTVFILDSIRNKLQK